MANTSVSSFCDRKIQKAKYNLIYRIRKLGQGRVDTRRRMIYYFFEDTELVSTKKHSKLCKNHGFQMQSELMKTY